MVPEFLKKLPGAWLLALIPLIWITGITLRTIYVWLDFVIRLCVLLTIIVVATWLVYLLIKLIQWRWKVKKEKAEAPVSALVERISEAAESSKNLPWYLVIGPAASGKTSILRNSGMEFSYVDSSQGRMPVGRIESTRDCDFFFTEDAVILDTSGQYVDFCSEGQAKDEFLSILSNTRKLRKQNPISALIMAIDVSRLLYSNQEAVEEQARNIRFCIEEAISELQVKLPVYLIFTKCDLIYGFTQYFGDLDAGQRGQIWGGILSGEEIRKPEDLFSLRCRQLFDILMEDRDSRLASTQRQNRGAVYTFPAEFGIVYQRLAQFVRLLFQSISKEKPGFRGFFFTSAEQGEAPPASFTMQNVAGTLASSVPLPEEPLLDTSTQPKGYFIKDTFDKTILSDRDPHELTKTALRRNMIVRFVSCGIILFALLSLITLVSVSYYLNKGIMRDTHNAAILLGSPISSSSQFDQNLDDLRKSIVRLEKFSILWSRQRRQFSDTARRFYLLKKYGSSKGWETKLRRSITIPVKIVKYENNSPVEIGESAEVTVSGKTSHIERILHTNKKGSATFKTKIEDGKATFEIATDYTPGGFEPQKPKICDIQPGETTCSIGVVQFIFSKSIRNIKVYCKDGSAGSEQYLPQVPVYIVDKKNKDIKVGETVNTSEKGVAEFNLDAQENTVFQIYCADSEINYETEKPYELTIESGEVEYSVEIEVSRKIKVDVYVYKKEGDEKLPQSGVFVSVGEVELKATDGDGNTKGTVSIIPTADVIKTNLSLDGFKQKTEIKDIDSEFSIVVEYVPIPAKGVGVQKVTEEEYVPTELPELVFDPSFPVSELEVWMYVGDASINGLEFTGEMAFTSAGQNFRLIQLKPEVGSEGRLVLPEKAKGNRLLLYHEDYWPLNIVWQQTEGRIKMTSIRDDYSLRDFPQENIHGAEYFFGIADDHYTEGRYEEAIKSYQYVMRLAPRLKYYLQLCWSYYNNNQFDEAAKHIRRGLAFRLLDDPKADEKIRSRLREMQILRGLREHFQ